MKRLGILLLSALLLLTLLAFTSCDQESVDSTRENLLNTCKDLFEPFFKVSDVFADESGNSENTADTEDTGDTGDTENTESTVDTENTENADSTDSADPALDDQPDIEE